MSWSQVVMPNLNITYTGGECLKAVADAFGLAWNDPNRYGAAMTDWNANEGNHPGEQPPAGVYVPVYFSLGDEPAGHVAIALPDGRVASSTQEGTHQGFYIHPNLDDLIRIYAEYHQSCTLLGWSESVDKLYVVADQGAANDMDLHQVISDAYRVSDPQGHIPSADIIQQKVDFATSTGNVQQVLLDIFHAGGWMGFWDRNHDALVSYRDCFAIPGDNPNQWATDRQMGGMTFDSQVHQELPPILANSSKADTLAGQLKDALADRDQAEADAKSAQEAAQKATEALDALQNAPKDPVTVDCQQQADSAVQTALKGVQTNPWPYVWQWFKGGGK